MGTVSGGNSFLVPRRPLALLLLESFGHVRDSGSSSSISPLRYFKSRTEAARILTSPPMANSSFTRKGDLRTWRSGAGPSTGTRNPVCSVLFTPHPLVPGYQILTVSTTSSQPGGSPITGLRLVPQGQLSRFHRTQWLRTPALRCRPTDVGCCMARGTVLYPTSCFSKTSAR